MREIPRLITLIILLFLFSCQKEKNSNVTTANMITSRLAAEPDMLNPILSSNGYSKQVTNHIFAYLVHYDYKTLQIAPMLATKLPEVENISEGALAGDQASTYQIHKTAVWDNGTPVTGRDVVFTIKTILNPKVSTARLRAFFGKIKTINVDKNNPKKFTVITKGKYFLIQEIFANVPIFPEYHYDPKGLLKDISIEELATSTDFTAEKEVRLQQFADEFHAPKFSRNPGDVIGCGAYQLREWASGQHLILEKKDNWWGDSLVPQYPLLTALPKQIIFKIIPDATSALTLLKSQELDVMGGIPSRDFEALQKNEFANTFLSFYAPSSMINYFIAINRNQKKLADKKVRRALAHLLDVDQLIQLTNNGFAERSIGPIFFEKKYFNKALKPLELNLEKARQLLANAGWTDSNNNGIVDKVIDKELVELNIDFLINPGETGNAIGSLLKENGKLVGINFNTITKEFRKKMELVRKREFDLTFLATGMDYSLDDLRQVWHTTSDSPSGGNRTGFGDARSDEIIEAIEQTDDPEKQKKLYLQIQSIIYDDQPCLFLFSTQQNIAINKKLNGTVSAKRPGVFENLLHHQ